MRMEALLAHGAHGLGGENGPYDDLIAAEATRRLRECTGLTQFEYAKLVKVAARALIDLERGVGNPTLGTLRKIAAPFGLEVRYMPKKPRGWVQPRPPTA